MGGKGKEGWVRERDGREGGRGRKGRGGKDRRGGKVGGRELCPGKLFSPWNLGV